MGKPTSSDCLTFNVASGQWERGTFNNGLLEDDVQGVIDIEGEGVFVVHSVGISFLATNSKSWVAGPVFEAPAVCGCKISSTDFVTIHMNDTYNVRQYSVSGREAHPLPVDLWPSITTKRHSPGCGATLYHLVVAGGVSEWDEVLASVEIFNIQKKSLREGYMRKARAFFQIIPVGLKYPRLLAIGGESSESTRATSEWWEEEENTWNEGPLMSTGRSNFAALMAPPRLVCSNIDPPAHSCPTDADPDQICTLSTSELGIT